jgi:hypothetical protein
LSAEYRSKRYVGAGEEVPASRRRIEQVGRREARREERAAPEGPAG